MKNKGKEPEHPFARMFYFDKAMFDLLKKASKELNTYQTEIVREALKEFFEKRGIK